MRRGYDQQLVDEQSQKVDKLVRDDLLEEKDRERQDPKGIALILTLNYAAVFRKKLEHSPSQLKSTGIISSIRSQPSRETKN